MNDQHPITPPPSLMRQWREQAPRFPEGDAGREERLIERAAQWGYDQRGEVNEAKLQQACDEELEACIAWMKKMGYWGEDGQAIPLLRAARRPKPPNLKDLALSELETILNELHRANGSILTASAIRRALEALPND